MNIKRFSLAATVFAALMLSACETTTTSSGGGSWTNIGTISEGNIKAANTVAAREKRLIFIKPHYLQKVSRYYP